MVKKREIGEIDEICYRREDGKMVPSIFVQIISRYKRYYLCLSEDGDYLVLYNAELSFKLRGRFEDGGEAIQKFKECAKMAELD